MSVMGISKVHRIFQTQSATTFYAKCQSGLQTVGEIAICFYPPNTRMTSQYERLHSGLLQNDLIYDLTFPTTKRVTTTYRFYTMYLRTNVFSSLLFAIPTIIYIINNTATPPITAEKIALPTTCPAPLMLRTIFTALLVDLAEFASPSSC